MIYLANNMEQFHSDVLKIIRSTRSISFPNWGIAEVIAQKSDSASDVVTRLDIEVESYLAKEFTALDSSITFVGEELGGDRNVTRKWLVDPIDGTAHFIRGLPFCSTMVALIEDGVVNFSAIYDFVTDTMYHAVRGGGAFKEGERIHVSNRPIEAAYVAYESNLSIEGNIEHYMKFRKLANAFNMVVSGYEYLMVATGKIEGRVCIDPYGKDHDFAPGSLLVSEAGGVVTNIRSNSYDYTNLNFLATNKLVHDSLTQGPDALFPIL